MLTLNDKRAELWQWDTGRELKVEGECSQVHFSNKIQGRSIDVDVVDGVAKIPDVLLQTDGTLNAWAFVGTAENGYTKVSKSFVVNKRNRPADYVFTPTDQTSIKELNDRLEKLEENQDPEAVSNAVKEYLKNNPIKEEDPTVPQWAKEEEKPKYTAKEVGAIGKEELQGAVDMALEQAKASGEFDGAQGEKGEKGDDGYTPVKGVDYFDGKDGADGKDGYTPQKNVDYFDGKDGRNGSDGKNGQDGTSPIISVSAITGGHRITITDKNGTKSVDVLDGQDGKDGSNGAAGSAGKDGSDGADGQDGADGVGIASIEQTTTSTADDGNNVITITLTNGQTATFTVQNGSRGSTGPAGKDGADGKDGSDATVTSSNIQNALGYTPAKQTDVNNLSKELDGFNEVLESGELVGASAYQVAKNNGFVGTEKEWIASLHASNPKVLTKVQYPTEAEAIAYMNEQGDNNAVYVWDNKVYCSAEIEVTGSTGLTGVCLRGYRNSASSGIKLLEGASLFIFPVSTFTVPITIDFSPYGLASSPYIYGGTTPTAFPTTVYDNEAVVTTGAKGPVTFTDLKGCTYLAFAIGSQPNGATIKVNGTEINLTLITSPSEIESAMSGGGSGGTTETIITFIDSGITFTSNVGQASSCQQYLDARNTYIAPVPSGYCESKVAYNTNGTHYLNKYNFATMTGMFTALATANPDYVTETLLGKDSTNTYEIKSYVLDAPSSISSGYESAMGRDKPTFIVTAGLHGVEPDAVHSVYHFMKDLCENYMESDHLEYLRNNIKFVIVPLANPWGYVNQSYHNANNVDLNKNFAHGYRTNGTANTGANAYSEVETQLLKGVFDSYSNAVFHLECHGKYGEDTSIAQTIWFSLMRSLNSDLIEICAETITKQIGRRTYKLGHNANKSVGGYITYYGMNGRPKDYTGTEYGMLSCTIEGSGKLYGTTGYSIDTQKVNTEALENFILRVFDALNSRVEVF